MPCRIRRSNQCRHTVHIFPDQGFYDAIRMAPNNNPAIARILLSKLVHDTISLDASLGAVVRIMNL